VLLCALIACALLLYPSTARAQSREDTAVATVARAYDLLLNLSFLAPRPATLLTDGRDALVRENRRAQRPTPALPELPADRVAAFGTFRESYRAYLATLPAGVTPQSTAATIVTGMAQSLHEQHTVFLPGLGNRNATGSSAEDRPIGVGISLAAGLPITVARVAPNGPAEGAGLLPGDVILRINGMDVRSADGAQALTRALVRGSTGIQVLFALQRGSEMREALVVEGPYFFPVLESRVVGNGMGYLRVGSFPASGVTLADGSEFLTDLDRRLGELEAQGVSALILDLRDNPGGSLASAGDLLGRFLPGDTLTIRMSGQEGRITTQVVGGPLRPVQLPMAVLVNQRSFSAAEMTAATFEENHRAVLVGQKTSGVLNAALFVPLPGGDGLEVAFAAVVTARDLYRIDRTGVAVDVTVQDRRDAFDYQTGRDPQLNEAMTALLKAPPPEVHPLAAPWGTIDPRAQLAAAMPAAEGLAALLGGRVQTADARAQTQPNEAIGYRAHAPLELYHTMRERGWRGGLVQNYLTRTGRYRWLQLTLTLYATSEGAHRALIANDYPDLQERQPSAPTVGDEAVVDRGVWAADGSLQLSWRRGRVVGTLALLNDGDASNLEMLASAARLVDGQVRHLPLTRAELVDGPEEEPPAALLIAALVLTALTVLWLGRAVYRQYR
jgi:carboxyl-terminal processing protease